MTNSPPVPQPCPECGGEGWRPIEEHDGSSHAVLLWCPVNLNPYLCTWGPVYDESGKEVRKGWRHFGGYGSVLNDTPTHFMEVPPTPAGTGSIDCEEEEGCPDQ